MGWYLGRLFYLNVGFIVCGRWDGGTQDVTRYPQDLHPSDCSRNVSHKNIHSLPSGVETSNCPKDVFQMSVQSQSPGSGLSRRPNYFAPAHALNRRVLQRPKVGHPQQTSFPPLVVKMVAFSEKTTASASSLD